MDPRPVLFLDFDGPLTNARAFVAYDQPLNRTTWTTADPVVIGMLNTLYDEYKFLTVLTTMWRIPEASPSSKPADVVLRDWGFKGEFHPDWKTPPLFKHREFEIQRWLQKNHESVLCYACLDDENMPPWTNNVLVDSLNGLTDIEQFIKLEEILSYNPKHYVKHGYKTIQDLFDLKILK